MCLNTGSGGTNTFLSKVKIGNVGGREHLFSTHEWMYLWKCKSFWDRKCLDSRGTRTPSRITYRSMKYFDQEAFNRELSNVPFHVCDVFDDVDDIAWAQQHLLSSVINIHAPLKHRFLRTNQVPYMNGQLRKAIHQRNMWRNKHFKDKRNSFAREKYVHHRNNVVKLTKSSVKTYFKNKCESCHGNSKQFCKTVKPFLCKNSNSGSGNKILLNEKGRIVSDASEVAEIFNAFYGSIAGYPVNCDDGLNDISLTDAIKNIVCMKALSI